MYRVIGGDPRLLDRRAMVMDQYVQLQRTHPNLPPDQTIVAKAVHSVRRLFLRYFENIGNWI